MKVEYTGEGGTQQSGRIQLRRWDRAIKIEYTGRGNSGLSVRIHE